MLVSFLLQFHKIISNNRSVVRTAMFIITKWTIWSGCQILIKIFVFIAQVDDVSLCNYTLVISLHSYKKLNSLFYSFDYNVMKMYLMIGLAI